LHGGGGGGPDSREVPGSFLGSNLGKGAPAPKNGVPHRRKETQKSDENQRGFLEGNQ